MKQYGFNKATEFTRKQINVIWVKAKNGELKVEKWYMSELYNLADYYGADDNRSIEQSERFVKRILEAVFSNDIETAQRLIDEDKERVFALYGKKYQDEFDKSLVA